MTKQTTNIITIDLTICLLLLCLFVWFDNKKIKQRAISLPEEIGVAVKGDKLIVDSVDKDSVYVVFDNERNK